jgi:hypothetical protein
MTSFKTLSVVAAMILGGISFAAAQGSPPSGGSTTPSGSKATPSGGSATNKPPAGGGVGTVSGKTGSAQNNNRGPGKNPQPMHHHHMMKHHMMKHHMMMKHHRMMKHHKSTDSKYMKSDSGK